MSGISGRLLALIEKRGVSYGELAELTGVPKSALQRYATGGTAKIPLERLEMLAKALGVSPGYLMGWEKGVGGKKSAETEPVRALERIPVIGSVRAGWDGLAREECDGYELADVCSPDSYFYLRVTGDSMAPHINEGELALVRRQNTADSGDIVIAVVNGEEGTIKRYVRQGAAVILQPLNPKYEPMVLAEEELEGFRIAGKVVQTVRRW